MYLRPFLRLQREKTREHPEIPQYQRKYYIASRLNFLLNIPNALTLANLFFGCLAIIYIAYGDLVSAAYFVGAAAVCDFLDGFAARVLKAYSAIGKDLDSLADMVTFGVVPGFMMFKMIAYVTGTYYGNGIGEALNAGGKAWYALAGLLIPVFSCLRLAKFNNDKRQSENFIGLPTPANAILICSLPLVFDVGQSYQAVTLVTAPFVTDGANLAIATCMLSLLLVTEIPMFSLKFRHFGWVGNQMRYLFIATCITMFILLDLAAIPLSILLYITVGVVQNIFSKKET